jgi:potassium-transporting ATPase KdpC subunit
LEKFEKFEKSGRFGEFEKFEKFGRFVKFEKFGKSGNKLEMLRHLYPATAATLLFAFLTGIVFPLVITAMGLLFFPSQARGSFVTGGNGQIVGSRLIAQEFKSPRYFHPRPSAAGSGYSAIASGGTNLGPTSDKLINGTKDHSFIGINELTGSYRLENGLGADAEVPVDAVTRSGSGLDADISIQNAQLQGARVAKERHLSPEAINDLIEKNCQHGLLGFIGEPRVNVLILNLAVDQAGNAAKAPGEAASAAKDKRDNPR